MIDHLPDAQIRWACRRGMLELDLIFERYYDHQLLQASPQERLSFERLLCEQDQDLYTWLIKQENPPPQFLPIISTLLSMP